MKICAYVQEAYAKSTYKNECMDSRQFVGLRVVVDSLERNGYEVEYAGIATVHKYDIVLVSITAFCDWWSFLEERSRWQKGDYKIFVGGAGVLHVTPFLPYVDAFMIGRGEESIVEIVQSHIRGERAKGEGIIYSDTFSEDSIYRIRQATESYPHAIKLGENSKWQEGKIGCNHRCLFCSYTWSRKQNFSGAFSWDSGKVKNMEQKECALLDYADGSYVVDWKMIRTTAIDGFSERIRFSVNKKIKNEVIIKFLIDAIESEAIPHVVRIFNIIGYPTENADDWRELINAFEEADKKSKNRVDGKKWLFGLQNNHFIPYPATPLACAPFSMKNYRDSVQKELNINLPKRRLYAGQNIDLIESQNVESLSTVLLNLIVARAEKKDQENVMRLARTKKFWSLKNDAKVATLSKYFDIKKMCGAYKPENLPSRYLRTYASVEKMWGNTPLEIAYREG